MPTNSDASAELDHSAVPATLWGDFGLARTIEALLFVADRALSAVETFHRDRGVRSRGSPSAGRIDRALPAARNRAAGAPEPPFGSSPPPTWPTSAGGCSAWTIDGSRHGRRWKPLGSWPTEARRHAPRSSTFEGVDSDSALATLLARNLIRKPDDWTPRGGPAVFTTTDTFLAYFGLTSLDDLPELDLASPPNESVETPPNA